MDFDILIPTRNRIEILKISLPLMISQGRLPRQMIVVDASDNHFDVKQLFEKELSGKPIDLHFIESESGITYQRNLGLRSIESPVVFIPDDDFLWFSNYAESVM